MNCKFCNNPSHENITEEQIYEHIVSYRKDFKDLLNREQFPINIFSIQAMVYTIGNTTKENFNERPEFLLFLITLLCIIFGFESRVVDLDQEMFKVTKDMKVH